MHGSNEAVRKAVGYHSKPTQVQTDIQHCCSSTQIPPLLCCVHFSSSTLPLNSLPLLSAHLSSSTLTLTMDTSSSVRTNCLCRKQIKMPFYTWRTHIQFPFFLKLHKLRACNGRVLSLAIDRRGEGIGMDHLRPKKLMAGCLNITQFKIINKSASEGVNLK